MAYKFYNPNPKQRFVSDCTIRAICLLTDQDWDSVYVGTTFEGFLRKTCLQVMIHGAHISIVWDISVKHYQILVLCYTVKDFCNDHPQGKYLLALDQHVVAVKDGDYYDTWDSGNEIPFYYWTKGE